MAEYLKLAFSLADSSRLLSLGLLVSSQPYHRELTCLLCTSRYAATPLEPGWQGVRDICHQDVPDLPCCHDARHMITAIPHHLWQHEPDGGPSLNLARP